MLWLFLLLILNLWIAPWDAYIAGRVWGAVTGWMKFITWCAIIMSACGFIEVSIVMGGFVALSAHWVDEPALLSLTYPMIIVAVIGTGLLLAMNGWINSYKRRMAVTGWNPFAQVNVTHDALDGGMSSSAFSSVWEFFKPDKDEDWKSAYGKLGILFILLITMAPLTYIFFQMGRRRSCYMRTAGPEWS